MDKTTTSTLTLLVGAAIGWACNQGARVDDSWAQESCSQYDMELLEIDEDNADLIQTTNMMPVSVAVDEHGNYVVLLRSCKN